RSVALALSLLISLFSFNDPPTTEIYTLSLHDALPISAAWLSPRHPFAEGENIVLAARKRAETANIAVQALRGNVSALIGSGGNIDRKSTRLNSSHRTISYAVFCLKKKKKKENEKR